MRRFILLIALVLLPICSRANYGEENPPEDKATVDITHRLIDSLRIGKGTNTWRPHLGSLDAWSLNVDTYSYGVPSSTIAALYNHACKKVASLYKEAEIKTFYWKDVEGYPRQATVVQYNNEVAGPSYLLISVSNNNDNDNFSFSYKEGTFETELKAGKYLAKDSLKVMKDWHLPKGLLEGDAQ